MGTKTIDRVSVRPAKSVRAKSNASGTPNTTQIAVDTMEVRSDNHKASSAAWLVSNPGTSCRIPANNAMKEHKNAALTPTNCGGWNAGGHSGLAALGGR